jgi:hypothetical protein
MVQLYLLECIQNASFGFLFLFLYRWLTSRRKFFQSCEIPGWSVLSFAICVQYLYVLYIYRSPKWTVFISCQVWIKCYLFNTKKFSLYSTLLAFKCLSPLSIVFETNCLVLFCNSSVKLLSVYTTCLAQSLAPSATCGFRVIFFVVVVAVSVKRGLHYALFQEMCGSCVISSYGCRVHKIIGSSQILFSLFAQKKKKRITYLLSIYISSTIR